MANQDLKRRIHVLGTGGTIAGAQSDSRHLGYTAATYGIDWLLNAVPGLHDLAILTGEQLVNIGSQDMDDRIWLQLARRVDELLSTPAVDAVLITHGTDTLEETAYFLSLVIASPKPVVLVGSMRPATALGADGPANIYNGVALATDARAAGRGTLLCLDGEIHRPRHVTKAGTMSSNAFCSSPAGLAGVVLAGRVEWFEVAGAARAHCFSIAGRDELPRVDIIYAYPGMSADLIDSLVAAGTRGLVIAGVGAGNINRSAIARLSAAVANGIPVVRSSRVARPMVFRNAEVNDDHRGFVAARDLNPGKSRVLLQLALTVSTDAGRIQEYFERC